MASLAAARLLTVRAAPAAAAATLALGKKQTTGFACSLVADRSSSSSSSSFSTRSSSSSSSNQHRFNSDSDSYSYSNRRGFAASPSSVNAGPFSGPEGRHDEREEKPDPIINPDEKNAAAATFGVLSSAWALTAAALLLAPEATLSWGFAAAAFPSDGGAAAMVPLARALGAAQLVGATALWALRDGHADGAAARPGYRRLSLGLGAATATGAVSALVGAESMSGSGLVAAVAAFGSTAAALARFWPGALSPQAAALEEAAARRRRVASSSSSSSTSMTSSPPNALLMTLSVAALAGGAAYIAAPAATLAAVLGPSVSLSGPAVAGAPSAAAASAAALSTGPAPSAVVLWRALGGGLLVLPAILTTAKEAHESGGVAAGAPPARRLTAAVAAASAAHAAALYPLFSSSSAAVGGTALPLAIGTWALVSGIGAWSAFALPGGHGPAVEKEMMK